MNEAGRNKILVDRTTLSGDIEHIYRTYTLISPTAAKQLQTSLSDFRDRKRPVLDFAQKVERGVRDHWWFQL